MEFACTEQEFRIFEQLVDEEELIGSFSFYLELVLLGMKPGTCPAISKEVELFREDIEEMGINIKQVTLDFIDVGELPDYAKEKKVNRIYFLAKDPEHLKTLKDRYKQDERDDYRRDFGLFMGYPKEDVEWFVRETSGYEEAFEKSKKILKQYEDFDYIRRIVMYVPKPTQECFERARKTAENYIKAIKEADRRFDSGVGEKLIEVECNR